MNMPVDFVLMHAMAYQDLKSYHRNKTLSEMGAIQGTMTMSVKFVDNVVHTFASALLYGV